MGALPVCLRISGMWGGCITDGPAVEDWPACDAERFNDGKSGLIGEGSPDCRDVVGVCLCSSAILREDVSDEELGLLSARYFSTTNLLNSSLNSLSTPAFQISFCRNMFSRNTSFSLLKSSRLLSIQAINPVSRTCGSFCCGVVGEGVVSPAARGSGIGRGERKGEGGADPDCGLRVGDWGGGRSVMSLNVKVVATLSLIYFVLWGGVICNSRWNECLSAIECNCVCECVCP
jgi:hypothetical protein